MRYRSVEQLRMLLRVQVMRTERARRKLHKAERKEANTRHEIQVRLHGHKA